MTAYMYLRSLQRTMMMVFGIRAALYAVSIVAALLAVAHVFALSSWSIAVAILAGAGALVVMGSRVTALRSLSRIALWVEERNPGLRYALVTVADGIASPSLDAQALGTVWWTRARQAVLRSLVAPVIVAAIVVAVGWWLPTAARRTASRDASLAIRTTRGVPGLDVLATVHVEVSPPPYANTASTRMDDPTSISALVGSVVTMSGEGDASGVTVTADSAARSVAHRRGGWSVMLTMPVHAAIVRLHSDAGRSRLIVLAPIADAAPVVTLLIPAHDTIVRIARGAYPLRAQVRDDIGLRDAAFELVISSGTGENFSFRTTTLGRTAFARRTDGVLESRVSLDSLALKPGDILQLRAVARDANNVSGPGTGSSDTRSLRVARADEYDSVSVDAAAPPEAEGQLLSERMLIDLTQALVTRMRVLDRAALVHESQRIADDQRKLRKRVGDVVFQRLGVDPLSEEGSDTAQSGKLTPEEVLKRADAVTGAGAASVMDVEGDETPILSINKPLLEAFNAMWDAGRALEVGEPQKALPPMRVALAAIQRARQAERIYLRGRPSAVIVDVAKARLSGKDKGVASIRERREAVDPLVRRRSATFERVTALIARSPDAAADSLLVMRVNALGDSPALALALDDAARVLRRRDTAGIPLAWARVRRALGGVPAVRAGIAPWLGVP